MTIRIKSKDENPKGLHRRYIVLKEGEIEEDKDAIYFVLRLDKYGDDPIWTSHCRNAAKHLAEGLIESGPRSMEQMADELLELVDWIEKNQRDEQLCDQVIKYRNGCLQVLACLLNSLPEEKSPLRQQMVNMITELRKVLDA